MTCLFKSREQIIRERIAELEDARFFLDFHRIEHATAINRAISRMYKLINKK